jgi:aspartate oxidase
MKVYEKSLLLSQRAMEIAEKNLGQNHPTTMKIKNNYNFLLSEMSEKNEEK